MMIAYGRVSTAYQCLHVQEDAPKITGCSVYWLKRKWRYSTQNTGIRVQSLHKQAGL